MIKSDKVIFLDKELEDIFDSLEDEDPIKKGIIEAIKNIRENSQVGELMGKSSVILHNYKKKYGVKTLRVYDLPLYYRLMYTITPRDVEIISTILDWKNHKDYDKLCKRKK